MTPSLSLQSRISAFEAFELGNNGQRKLNGGVGLPPHLSMPRKPVHILEFDSTSPTADHLHAILPIQPVATPSRPSSPPALGRKSSLIDFSELSSSNFKPVSIGAGSTTGLSTSRSEPSRRSQLPFRTSTHVPPLPPRQPSITSLRTTLTTTPPPLPKRQASSPMSSLSKTPTSPSLLSPSDSHTYPPASPRLGFQSRHMPSSSTSSFHSVSLSSDGGDTRDSLDGSYEAVSSTTATNPTTTSPQHDWTLSGTPKLPQRPWEKQAALSSPMGSSSMTARRPAPPPPHRRSAIPLSRPHTPASSPHHLLAPIPLNAHERYDAVFDCNLPQNPRKGRASGWRGLSVDLLTNGEKPEFGDDQLRNSRLSGTAIKHIWSCSKLPRARLREIWNECDTGGLGSLDREAFARGMWRIDEELSRARQQDQTRTPLAKPVGFIARRVAPATLRKHHFILR